MRNEWSTSGSSRSRSTAAALLLAVALAAQPSGQSPRYDTIIRNGIIVDGSGLPPFWGDIGIRGARIAKVGDLSKESAERDVSAFGLMVAPGFINIHSHASMTAVGTARNMLMQGVTTEIINADGGGPTKLFDVGAVSGNPWLAAVNVGQYIGFNSIWSSVVGADDRRPTEDEIARMRRLVVDGMEAGAWGVSAGLDYKPGFFATTDEVVRIVSAAAPWRTNFTNHDRVIAETSYSSRAGIAETLAIAERANLLGVVTHMKVTGRERGTAAKSLQLIADSTKRGHYAAADVYPYLAGQTGLGALLLPAWALDGGRPALLKRLADPGQRPKIVAETEQILADRFGGEGIYLPSLQRELTDVQRSMGGVSAGEAIAQLLEQTNQISAIIRFGLEEDLRRILQYPDASIACDCGATTATNTHPRNYGTYPRVLGRYVREEKLLTWQDAIRKMTALPAATIGLYDRGYLAPGMMADIVVFDPMTIIDHATYESPALLSTGVRHLFVNGARAVRSGIPLGGNGGRLLRRGEGGTHEPSRAMSRGARALSLHATSGDLTLSIDLAQSGTQRSARGTFRIVRKGNVTRPAGELGVLQVAPGWATVSTENYVLLVERAEGAADASVIVFSVSDGEAHKFSVPWTRVRITGARSAAPAAVPRRDH